MAEKPESDDFDEADEEVIDRGDDVDLDAVFKDLDRQRRRGNSKPVGEPAWRKLEKFMEEKRTAELLSDFDDDFAELDEDDDPSPRGKPAGKVHAKGVAKGSGKARAKEAAKHKPARGGKRGV